MAKHSMPPTGRRMFLTAGAAAVATTLAGPSIVRATGLDLASVKPRIMVIGIGRAGGNAVNHMIGAGLENVEFVVANTDARELAGARTSNRVQLGAGVTHGFSAGNRPDLGRAAAKESMAELAERLNGCHMVFIIASMGGGTGTGAAPIIARVAREMGILTVGVVTQPFLFEGAHRRRIADAGIEELRQITDTLIVIPNQNLFQLTSERTTFADAFTMVDDAIHSGVCCVTDLINNPSSTAIDFADIRSIMSEMGATMIGSGEAQGDHRGLLAAEAAMSNPLLPDISLRGAHGALIRASRPVRTSSISWLLNPEPLSTYHTAGMPQRVTM